MLSINPTSFGYLRFEYDKRAHRTKAIVISAPVKDLTGKQCRECGHLFGEPHEDYCDWGYGAKPLYAPVAVPTQQIFVDMRKI